MGARACLSMVNSSCFLRVPMLQSCVYGYFTQMSMKPVSCRWCFTLTWQLETWKSWKLWRLCHFLTHRSVFSRKMFQFFGLPTCRELLELPSHFHPWTCRYPGAGPGASAQATAAAAEAAEARTVMIWLRLFILKPSTKGLEESRSHVRYILRKG